MTIFEHPLWSTLLPHLYIRRGAIGVNGARHRIEVRKTAPVSVFEIRTACAYCKREIENVRVDARGAWTFNASCPLEENPKCARMPGTTAVCSDVRAAIEQRPAVPVEGTLF